jgi:hypothetical protein
VGNVGITAMALAIGRGTFNRSEQGPEHRTNLSGSLRPYTFINRATAHSMPSSPDYFIVKTNRNNFRMIAKAAIYGLIWDRLTTTR